MPQLPELQHLLQADSIAAAAARQCHLDLDVDSWIYLKTSTNSDT